MAPPHNPPPAATAPGNAAANPFRFENQSAGVLFNCPAGWKLAESTPTKFTFEGPAAAEQAKMSLDVPVLPPHIPGLIPILGVENGFVDDVKKRVMDANVTYLPDPTVADASQKRVKITGQMKGSPSITEAALFVHGDRVYILSIDCDPEVYPVARTALDTAVNSLQWEKR